MLNIDVKTVKQLARGRWLEIIPAIDGRFSEAVEKIGIGVPCPIGTGTKDGFNFKPESAEDGHAFTNTGKPLGSGFDVLMWANGWDFRQALESVNDYLGNPTAEQHTNKPPTKIISPETKPQKPNTLPAKLWSESQPAISDPVRTYLNSRGLGEIKELPTALRCNALIDYREVKNITGKYPALIGRIEKDGQLVGIQRHYLTNEGNKADLKNNKSMMGVLKGGISGGAVRLGEPTDTLALVEGIETGLAVQLATNIPTWSSCTAALLAKVEIPETVKTIFIFADKDKNTAGKKAAEKLAERLRNQGKKAFIFMPPITRPEEAKGVDWLDVFNQEGKTPFQHALNSIGTTEENIEKNPPEEPPLKLTEPLYFFPEMTERGNPLNVYENFTYMLNKYGVKCRYDVIKKDVISTIPKTNFSKDNGKTSVRAHILSVCKRNKYPTDLVDDYLNLTAEENHVNPVIDWVNSKPWDGVDRWENFIEQTIKTEESKQQMAWILISKWMLSALAMAENGLKGGDKRHEAHGILIFTGAQGIGKTAWFKKLVGEHSELALDGFLLDPNNKDSVRTAISHWLVELGEIDSTFRKSDLSALKAFITRPTDKLRKPYGRDDSIYPRRTVFFGSVNDRQFLMDATGNRRYWVIEPTFIDYQHNFDMQQIWAEAYDYYKNGMQWWLSPEELKKLNEDNQEYEAIEPLEELLLSQFDFYGNTHLTFTPMTTTEVLQKLGKDNLTKGDTMKMARLIEKHTGKKPKRRNHQMPPQFASKGKF